MDGTTLWLLANLPLNGWVGEPNNWQYVSANSFSTLAEDTTSRYTVGTKLSCTDAGVIKYFYVVSSSFSTDTTVTITGGSDYTLSGGAITNPMYSYMATAYGFPGSFAFTPAYTGWAATPTFNCALWISGRAATVIIRATGTSSAGDTTITLPIASTFSDPPFALVRAIDNGGTPAPGLCYLSTPTVITFCKNVSGDVFTTSGAKTVTVTVGFPI